MPADRERPYAQFNFLVDLGGNDGPGAGFSEVSGVGMETTVADYREGNAKDQIPVKIPGRRKPTEVTLKRGLVAAPRLREWLEQTRKGGDTACRTVTIQLLGEDRTSVVRSWKLLRARIVKYDPASLNAKGNDVAMEELVLSCEGLEAQ